MTASNSAQNNDPDFLPVPVDRIPANRLVPIQIFIYMHSFRDRFFYKREDQPKLEAFLKTSPAEESRPTLTLLQTPHFLSGVSTKEELQKRSAELLANHFGFAYDTTRSESETEQLQRHINQITTDVLDVLEVDAGVLDRLKALLATVDQAAWNHAANVAGIGALLALSIGYTDKELLRDIAVGGYLHDLGLATAGLPPRSRESDYSPSEMEVYRKHPAAGLELIEVMELPVSENTKIIVYQHEERFDGSGFPMKAAGPDIFEPAQIVAIATRLDCHIRPDQPGFLSIEDALRKVGEENSTPGRTVDFNPALLSQIFDALTR
jgi:HD-GYP domain-containing protein (c-di-GMP phosphodiesterase class II)